MDMNLTFRSSMVVAFAAVAAAVALLALPNVASGASYGQLAGFGSFGTDDGQFTKPLFVGAAPPSAGAPSGQAFVADFNPNGPGFTETIRIEEFGLDGTFRRTIMNETGSPITGLLDNGMSGFAIDPARNALYVARPAKTGAAKDKIDKYALDTGQRSNYIADTGTFASPGPIVVDTTSGDVFAVGEFGANSDPRIQKYSSAGLPVGSKFGATGPEDGGAAPNQFDSSGIDGLAVRHLAAGGSKLYVLDFRTADPDIETDTDAPRVTRYTNSGTGYSFDSGSELRSHNETATDVAFTEGAIAADPNGNVYLDLDSSEETPTAVGIIRVTESGQEVFRFGAPGNGDCQFSGPPRGLALDASGNLYAIDANNADGGPRRIVRFGSGGSGCGITTTNQKPHAAFTFNPGSPGVGEAVSFDATGSEDADGTIEKYEWDLDGDGAFETDTGSNPHATKTYGVGGTVPVGLRVTDNEDGEDTTNLDVTVTSGPSNARVTKDRRVLSFVAASGQQNALRIVKTNKITVRDPNAAIDAVSPCMQGATVHEVVCPSSGIREINVQTGDGDDRIEIQSRTSDVIDAGDSNDYFDTGAGKDGHDTFIGGHGVDTIDYSQRTKKLTVDETVAKKDGQGGEGADVRPDVENIVGGSQNDVLIGTERPNRLDGGDGNDMLTGAGGDDVFDGGSGADTIAGGSGIDRVTYAGHSGMVIADLDAEIGDDGETGEHDTIGSDVENLTGGSGNDRLIGNGEVNVLAGGFGMDMLAGLGANDILQGGADSDRAIGGDGGADVADYSDHVTPVIADLDSKTGDDGTKGEMDTIGDDVEGLVGGIGADQLVGNNGDNSIMGGAGRDRLSGKAGRDALVGGADVDTLNAGGNDDFIDARDDVADRIQCGSGIDTILADLFDKPQKRSCENRL